MADTLRLNAIISDLLSDGETFDPTLAIELREAVDIEPVRRFSVFGNYSAPGNSIEGMTDKGRASLDDTETKSFAINKSRGLYVGRWRIVHDANAVTIEPRNADTIAEPGDTYRLRFLRRTIAFEKAAMKPMTLEIPFIGQFSFIVAKWVPFKTPEKDNG
jgi:hypothetical protein